MQEESPEGGRFKKEVVVDGHSYLLLIRDEGGPPELQVSQSILNGPNWSIFLSDSNDELEHPLITLDAMMPRDSNER